MRAVAALGEEGEEVVDLLDGYGAAERQRARLVAELSEARGPDGG